MRSESREPGAPVAAGGIPLCVPHLAGNEWTYVRECLDTNFVSSVGPFVRRFETELAQRVGARFGIATSTGTAALHVALLVAGVERDDEVLVSSLTFIAPVNSIRYAGAWPVFIDAEPKHWQMDPAQVARFLEQECVERDGVVRNRVTGRRVRAILPVHILGHPVDMDPILALAKRYGLAVIEDATESLGATYKGIPTGHIADAGCFSFNGNKLITSGGGGMVVTDNAAMAERAKYLTTQAKDDAVEFIHGEVGYNYRLTNVQAALGVAQLEQVDAYLAAKRRIATRYVDGLHDVAGITTPTEAPWARSAWWLFSVIVADEEFGMSSRDLMRALDERGIQTRPLWQPVHLSPAHRDAQRRSCPVAEELNRTVLSLPCSVGLTDAEQERVIDAITTLASGAHRTRAAAAAR
ncbi:MAG TPA: LegC family aminotransferase [Gemmatimonadaceae bacterium]|nr:LegC family aminotransferase [Gemmatimonadaceae bacterium]